MPSTTDHKSKDKYPFMHPLCWLDRDGTRDLRMEGAVYTNADGEYCYGDRDAVVTLHLNAEGVEFLLDELRANHPGDGFTDAVQYLRDLAKHKVEAEAWPPRDLRR